MKTAAAILALASFVGCLAGAVLFFAGVLGRAAFESVFLVASLGWFVGASLWASRMKGGVAEEVLSS